MQDALFSPLPDSSKLTIEVVAQLAIFRSLIDLISEGVTLSNARGRFVIFNRMMTKMTGYTVEDANAADDFVAVLYPTRRLYADAMANLEAARTEGLNSDFQTDLVTKAGQRRTVRIATVRLYLDGDVWFLSAYRDVTARQRAQSELREVVEWLQAIIRSVDEGIALRRVDGDFEVFNDKMSEITGYTREAANEAPDFLALLYPDSEDYARVQQILQEVIASGERLEVETKIKTRHGESKTVLVSTSTMEFRDQVWILTTYRDITERQRMLEALRVSERKYKSLTNQLPVGVYRTTADGCVLHANPALAKILGYEDVDDMTGQCVVPTIHEDAEVRAAQQARLLEEEGVVVQEVEVETADGRTIWVRDTGRAILDETGGIEYIDGILEDITERKAAEEALQQFAMELQARNEELDAFSRTVAHDLKNPLNLIMGYTDLLVEELDDLPDELVRSSLRSIWQATKKMNNILEELMLLAGVRRGNVEPVPLDMDLIIDEVRDRLAHLIDQHNAELILPERWPFALGYGPWVEEVWTNYVSNAIKYGGRPPRIQLGHGRPPEPFAALMPTDLCSGESQPLCFWVRDNGEGLTPEQQVKLFTPFERLSNKSVTGHGLGLSIVKRIVAKLGGEVGVVSELGEGSLFYFTLPEADISD